MSDGDTSRRRWWVPALFVVGIVATLALAVGRSRQQEDERMDARCDLAALEARAPRLETVALDDPTLLALGGEALADILELCEAIEPWNDNVLRAWGTDWTPRLDHGRSIAFGKAADAEIRQSRRICPDGFERARQVADLPGRQRGYAVFEWCELESRGILSSSDVDYLEPPVLPLWRVHQMLLESELPEDLARRYFTAILVAAEIDERALGPVRVRDGRIEVSSRDDPPELLDLPAEGPLPSVLADAFDLQSGCIRGRISIAASEPIGSLRWLFEAEVDPEHCEYNTLTLAISEREQLLRPLRADLDLPIDGRGHPVDLELMLDGDGGWFSVGGLERGPDLAALVTTLDRIRPRAVMVRASPSTPARAVVDLLRVPDVWRARNRRELKLYFLLDDTNA